MKIKAIALLKLVYIFKHMKWYENCNEQNPQMTEEILVDLFRELGIVENATICLFTFKENTLLVKKDEEGFTFIEMEVCAPEYDDYVKLSYRFTADPINILDSEKREESKIEFNGLRSYKKFTYDFEAKKWNLSNI